MNLLCPNESKEHLGPLRLRPLQRTSQDMSRCKSQVAKQSRNFWLACKIEDEGIHTKINLRKKTTHHNSHITGANTFVLLMFASFRRRVDLPSPKMIRRYNSQQKTPKLCCNFDIIYRLIDRKLQPLVMILIGNHMHL